MSLFDRLFKPNVTDPNVTDLQEFTNSSRIELDKDNGIIRNVKVLGSRSNNNRIYPIETLKRALSLYEGMKVNVDHGTMPGARRDLVDRLGVLRNVKVQEDGLFGDLHFNPKHAFADQLMWQAEHDPNNIGFSHDATCRHSRRNGVMIIEEIQVVKCVDLVGQPATTVGLFESESKTMKRSILEIAKAARNTIGGKQLLKLCEQDEVVGEVPIAEVPVDVPVEASADDAIRAAFKTAILAVLDDASLDVSAMMKKIGDLLKAKEKIEGDVEPVEVGQATEAEHTSSKPNGVGSGGSVTNGKDNGDIQKMREQIEHMGSERSVQRLLDKHGVTVESDIFEALVELPDDKSREAILASIGTGKPKAERPISTGVSKFQESLQAGNQSEVTDGKSFAKSICQ